MGKTKQQDNPFIEPSQQHAVVDMRGKIANQSLRRELIARSMAERLQHYYIEKKKDNSTFTLPKNKFSY